MLDNVIYGCPQSAKDAFHFQKMILTIVFFKLGFRQTFLELNQFIFVCIKIVFELFLLKFFAIKTYFILTVCFKMDNFKHFSISVGYCKKWTEIRFEAAIL